MTGEPTADDLDTTPVKCPEGCFVWPKPREFRFVGGEISQNNYCRQCGAELVEADQSPIEVDG